MSTTMHAESPQKAAELIVEGDAPAGMSVAGSVSLTGLRDLELPENLHVTRLDLSGCKRLSVPAGLRCYELTLRDTDLKSLPADIRVEFRLDLSHCTALEALPEGLKVGSLVLDGCTNLTRLPDGLDVYFLDISGCAKLEGWPENASLKVGRLTARGCRSLKSLPAWLTELAQLDVRGCENLTHLPEGLRVTSWLDLADTALYELPSSMARTPLRWKGVPIDRRIAFEPWTITADEVLSTQNAELRRVLLERMGYEKFMAEAHARVLDVDRDPGGERRLLRVPMQGDEDLVCISVFCPSTGRQYIIRVPPDMRTCRQAAAWIAGFNDERDYRPIMET